MLTEILVRAILVYSSDLFAILVVIITNLFTSAIILDAFFRGGNFVVSKLYFMSQIGRQSFSVA